MRYALQIAYDGRFFSGWQRQERSRGIQEEVERALGELSSREITVVAAGRTDKGVHARGQVISCDLPRIWEPRRLRLALDACLPPTIRTIRVAPVPSDFDARYHAQWREYVYFLWFARHTYPHLSGYSWSLHGSWEDEAVRQGCAYLEGTHDFSSFCRASDRPENPLRTLHRVSYHRKGPLGWLRVRGNAFLTNMVRIIVGSLHNVGVGRRDPLWIRDLLEKHRHREAAGRTAPPEGLFLWRVGYKGDLWNFPAPE